MNLSKEQLAVMLKNDLFPRSAKYDPEWVVENLMGPHPLWLTEWLCESVRLEPGMRVLDLGCGRAMSSVFLAKEFGVEVWANDLWISASENWQIVCEAGVERSVFPIHAEAHVLPYANDFFDAIISIDAYHYFGTDTFYLDYITKFLKPGGQLGIVCPGLTQEADGEVPEHLVKMFRPEDLHAFWSFQTAAWWQRFWSRSGLVDEVASGTLEDGWRCWVQTYDIVRKAQAGILFGHLGDKAIGIERDAIEVDQGQYVGLVRASARRKAAGA